MIDKFMEGMARNRWLFLYRILGVILLLAGVVSAALGAAFRGFTPVFWALLAIASFLGVICNSLFRIVLSLERKTGEKSG